MTKKELESKFHKMLYHRIKEVSKNGVNSDKMYQLYKYSWGFTKNTKHLFRVYISFLSPKEFRIICWCVDNNEKAWDYTQPMSKLKDEIKGSTIFMNEDWVKYNIEIYESKGWN